jgi:hypothetical protein
MNLPVGLIKDKCPITEGNVYRGFLAKNKSKYHNVIIICVKDNNVFWFCIDSSENSKSFFQRSDKNALVMLTKDEQEIYWPDSDKESYVFCGELGFCPGESEPFKSLDEFYEQLSNGAIVSLEKCPDSLFHKIQNAIQNSKTLSDYHKVLIRG